MFPESSIRLRRGIHLNPYEEQYPDMEDMDQRIDQWTTPRPIATEMHLVLRENYVKYWQRISFYAFYDAISASSSSTPEEIIICCSTVNMDKYHIRCEPVKWVNGWAGGGCRRATTARRPKIIGAIGKVNKKANNGRVCCYNAEEDQFYCPIRITINS